MRIALVSCVKSKRPVASRADDLYTSALFRGIRRFAESHADRWFILSAEHGLLKPETVIAPYDRTLNRMPIHERRAWASHVLKSLIPELAHTDTVIMLGGQRYREEIVPALTARGIHVDVPLAGLGLGQQLQWLNQHSSNE